jgi:hypothetical protein
MGTTTKKAALMNASLTIDEFCDCEKISRWTYFAMRRNGHGPDELRVPGTTIARITPKAHEAWRTRMEQVAKTKAMKLESARRDVQRRLAGKASAAAKRASA